MRIRTILYKIFLRKPRILALLCATIVALRKKPRTPCRVAPRGSLEFGLRKLAHSRLHVCVRDSVMKEGVAPCSETPNCVAYSSNTLREIKPGTAAFAGKTSASWKRGKNVENRYTSARFAQNVPRDLKFAQETPRMVRIRTLRLP